jgi:hypothetical protein
VHLTNHCKIFVNIGGLLDYHHLSVLLCFRSLRFLIQRRSLGRCAQRVDFILPVPGGAVRGKFLTLQYIIEFVNIEFPNDV